MSIKQVVHHQEVDKEEGLLSHTQTKDINLHKTHHLNHFYQSNKTNNRCTEPTHNSNQVNKTSQSKINTTSEEQAQNSGDNKLKL